MCCVCVGETALADNRKSYISSQRLGINRNGRKKVIAKEEVGLD
jgi:hypothetical protein